MRSQRRVNRIGLAIASVAAVTTVAGAASVTSAGAATAGVPGHIGTFRAVDGTSAKDVWAVGSGPAGTLIEHWNGAKWQVVPSPSPGTGAVPENELTGVAAISPANAWAVGFYASGPDPFDLTTSALIEHWNGHAWTRVPCPCASTGNGAPELASISAVSKSDIWAVGAGAKSPLIIHWNGKKWSIASLPGSAEDQLSGVSATSATSALAVGVDLAHKTTFSAHWNGKKWSVVKGPDLGKPGELNAVVATSATSAWAAGSGPAGKFAHWNGKTWSLVAGPKVAGSGHDFAGLAAAPGGTIWAVGKFLVKPGTDRTLTARWIGKKWSTVTSPNSGCCFSQLTGVFAPAADNVFAAGGNLDETSPLVERWNGKTWRIAVQ